MLNGILDKLHDENAILHEENAKLYQDNNIYRGKCRDLVARNKELEEKGIDTQSLHSRIEELTKQGNSLRETYIATKKEYDQIGLDYIKSMDNIQLITALHNKEQTNVKRPNHSKEKLIYSKAHLRAQLQQNIDD